MAAPSAPSPFSPPPFVFIVLFVFAFMANMAWPLPFLPNGWNQIPAVLLTLGGFTIFVLAAFAFRKARTPVSPYRPATALIVTGPFLRTRNPIYLAFAWIYLGCACWINSLWPLLFFPVVIFVIHRFVVLREEAHLEERFGKAYRDYKARTRRWM